VIDRVKQAANWIIPVACLDRAGRSHESHKEADLVLNETRGLWAKVDPHRGIRPPHGIQFNPPSASPSSEPGEEAI
jgi:hypothetical protein